MFYYSDKLSVALPLDGLAASKASNILATSARLVCDICWVIWIMESIATSPFSWTNLYEGSLSQSIILYVCFRELLLEAYVKSWCVNDCSFQKSNASKEKNGCLLKNFKERIAECMHCSNSSAWQTLTRNLNTIFFWFIKNWNLRFYLSQHRIAFNPFNILCNNRSFFFCHVTFKPFYDDFVVIPKIWLKRHNFMQDSSSKIIYTKKM